MGLNAKTIAWAFVVILVLAFGLGVASAVGHFGEPTMKIISDKIDIVQTAQLTVMSPLIGFLVWKAFISK